MGLALEVLADHKIGGGGEKVLVRQRRRRRALADETLFGGDGDDKIFYMLFHSLLWVPTIKANIRRSLLIELLHYFPISTLTSYAKLFLLYVTLFSSISKPHCSIRKYLQIKQP